MKIENKRLESLDILRGIDIFILVCFQPLVFWFLSRTSDLGSFEFLREQFSHCEWEGFSFWDIIMPLFLFMSGVAIPFSLKKYDGSFASYFRIFKRVVLLFILGMIVQGNLLHLDISKLKLYTNTLQAIGVGYFFCAIIFLNFKMRGRIISAALIFFTAWCAMSFCGDFTQDGNTAEYIDRLVLGKWRDCVVWEKDGSWNFDEDYRYTWILSSLNFIVTVMLGAFCATIMTGEDKLKNAKRLLLFAAILTVSGLLMSLQMPIIKKIWSSSMTLYSGGLCAFAMVFFYYLVDCKNLGKTWLGWFKIYGMNSIFAYVVSMKVNFRSIPDSILFGLKQFTGEYYFFLLDFCQYGIIFFMLYWMYKNKIFLKV